MGRVQEEATPGAVCLICRKLKTSSHKCCSQKLWKHAQLAEQMTMAAPRSPPKMPAVTTFNPSTPKSRPTSVRKVRFADIVGSERADNGFFNWEHMKIRGRIKQKQVLVLLDSGCTHNFISSKVVQALGLKVADSKPYVVHLPDGSNQLWDQQVSRVPLQIQTYSDKIDLGVMDLAHIDVILGQQWLFAKDPLISFRHHTVELNHEGNIHKLAGERGLPNLPIVTTIHQQGIRRVSNVALLASCRVCQSPSPRRDRPQEEGELPLSVAEKVYKTTISINSAGVVKEHQQGNPTVACPDCSPLTENQQNIDVTLSGGVGDMNSSNETPEKSYKKALIFGVPVEESAYLEEEDGVYNGMGHIPMEYFPIIDKDLQTRELPVPFTLEHPSRVPIRQQQKQIPFVRHSFKIEKKQGRKPVPDRIETPAPAVEEKTVEIKDAVPEPVEYRI